MKAHPQRDTPPAEGHPREPPGSGRDAPRSVRDKALSAVTTVYGIRHHGPGSARSLRNALAEQEPDIVLVEGPPEADGLVALAA